MSTANLSRETLELAIELAKMLANQQDAAPAPAAPIVDESIVRITIDGKPYEMGRVESFKSSGNKGYSLQTRCTVYGRNYAVMFALSEINSAPAEIKAAKMNEKAKQKQAALAPMGASEKR